MDANQYQTLLRLRHELAGMRFEIALMRCRRKYSDSQPRIPAGQPGGGQWASGDGGGEREEGESENTRFAGGLNDEDMTKTVQQFMSEKCKAGIGRRMPGEFLDSDLSIGEIIALKKGGDAAATRCIKLLNQDRFRK
jgi:hypothetical protein